MLWYFVCGIFHGTEYFWNDQAQFDGFEHDAVDAPWPYATSIGTMVVNQWTRYPMFQIRAIKEHWQPIYTILGGRYSYHHFCAQFFVGVSIGMDVFWCMQWFWSGNDWMWKNRPQSFHAEFPCIWGSSETINLMNKSGFRFLGTSWLGKGFPFWFSDFNYSSVKPNTAKILCCPWQITHMRRIFHCQLGALAPKNCLHLVGLVPDIKPSWRITGVLTIKQNNTSTWVCLKKYEHMVSRNLIVYHGFWSFSLLKCSFEGQIHFRKNTHLTATSLNTKKNGHGETTGCRFLVPLGRWKSSWRPLLSQWRPMLSSGKHFEGCQKDQWQ